MYEDVGLLFSRKGEEAERMLAKSVMDLFALKKVVFF